MGLAERNTLSGLSKETIKTVIGAFLSLSGFARLSI